MRGPCSIVRSIVRRSRTLLDCNILGELRGVAAFTFMLAVNTSHSRSMTTVHADTLNRAIKQLALQVMQEGPKLSRENVRH